LAQTLQFLVLRRQKRDIENAALFQGEIAMLLIIGIILLVLWALGFLAFHVTSGLIHLLLIIAVIVVIVHLVQGRRAV
jgi:uncharacterized membrane protein (DUF485 family)